MVAGLLLVSPSPLFASHPFDTLSVREAQAYRHVLEDDDRLVLIRYAMSDTPPADESAYSFDAAMLRLVDGSTTLQQLNPPFAGYGLAAFYFSAVDADTLVPWQSATIQAEIEGNPTLFESPQFDSTDSSTFVWNSTASVTSTAAELELDLPALLRSIETDDPDRLSQRRLCDCGGGNHPGRRHYDLPGVPTANHRSPPGAFQIATSLGRLRVRSADVGGVRQLDPGDRDKPRAGRRTFSPLGPRSGCLRPWRGWACSWRSPG